MLALLLAALAVLAAGGRAAVGNEDLDGKTKYYEEGVMKLWVIRDFLATSDAEDLYSRFEKKWDEDLGVENGPQPTPYYNYSWLYTTNVPGQNQKIRSNENIAKRREMAKQARKQNMFAYSKYELARHTSEFQRAKDILNQNDILATLSQIVSHEIADTHDMFVSCFRKDDFLNIHQDGSLGTFAFVLSLTKNWTVDDGGLLRLFCRGHHQKTIVPGFNTLSIFKVRPDMLDHDVSVVTTPTKRRYAVTGWWYLKEDSFSEAERAEQKKQRGAYGEL